MSAKRRRRERCQARPRTLHLVDVENLAGDAQPSAAEVATVLDRYREAMSPCAGDLVVLAANRQTAAAAGWAWPGPLVRPTTGPDGADLALLAESEPCNVVGRFERVVIASGDHIFSVRARELRAAGTRVEIVARPGSLAAELRTLGVPVRLLSFPADVAA